MRISTITNWAYGATALLSLASGASMYLASGAEDRERAAVAERLRFDSLTEEVVEDSLRLSEGARQYLVSGNPGDLVVYRREADQLGSVEQRIRGLRDVGARPEELAALAQGLHWADMLRAQQGAAIAAFDAGRPVEAHRILFGAEYEQELDRVGARIAAFQADLERRSDTAVEEATRASRLLRDISEFMVAATALLFLAVLFFVIKQRILRPVVRLSDVVSRLAEQDFDVEPLDYRHVDEIGDMAQAVRIFRENGVERLRLERARDADEATRNLVSTMAQRLQGCDRTSDLADVVGLFAGRILPGFAGRLYIRDDRSDAMVEACHWGEPIDSSAEFVPTHCWGIRRGQPHRIGADHFDIACPHLHGSAPAETLCVPLSVRGETIGLLYLEQFEAAAAGEGWDVYVDLMAETVALALANLGLREALKQIALVDPLTGLANRRELEHVLAEAQAFAEREQRPLACIMVDVDHFKRFNDQFGHDAGDLVLQRVGGLLAGAAREAGFAFRYGGEEFMLLLPGADLGEAVRHADNIRGAIRAIELDHQGQLLGPLSVSIGVAAFPDHGRGTALVQAADAALLQAKRDGRDRVVSAGADAARIAAA